MTSGQRARIGVFAGVALGAVLLAYGVYRVSHDGGQKPAPAAIRPVARLLVAVHDVARGATLSAGDVTTLAIEGEAPPGTLSSPADVVGRVAVNDIAARRLILAGDIGADAGAAGLSQLVKPGFRAITVDASDEIAVGSFLKPGDRVDVQVVLPSQGQAGLGQSSAWLFDIEVLAVGQTTGAGQGQSAANPQSARTVTLAMTPAEVSRFALARSAGRFYLTLRNPADRGRPAEATPPARRGVVRPTAPQGPIEVVVEGRREVLHPGAARP